MAIGITIDMINNKNFLHIMIVITSVVLTGCGDDASSMYGSPNISNKQRRNIVDTAESYLGCPAGSAGKKLTEQNCPNAKNLGPIQKFDCSSFTKHVYKSAGIEVNGPARAQCKNMIKKGNGKPRPGDIVCFGYKNKPITHIGIAIDEDKFIHAATVQNKQIKVSDLTKYKKPPYVGFVSANSF